MDFLAAILARKAEEVRRRKARAARAERARVAREPTPIDRARAAHAIDALRRPPGALPRVIAEIKLASPSRGSIRPRVPGEIARIARAYEHAGASAVSVLADRVGFQGSALDVRRAARATRLPVLFKEFVLDEVQLDLARDSGATLVLLLVRALSEEALGRLVRSARARGLEPVVEASDEAELELALRTDTAIVGVNARDLSTFEVDADAALSALARVPADRVAVFMSGVADAESFQRVALGRADAVLVGEGLMRDPDPGEKLRRMRSKVIS